LGLGPNSPQGFHVLRPGFRPDESSQKGIAMTYWRLHYHLIWSTQGRQPTLTAEREKMFYGVLYRKAAELGVKIHAAGNVEDHVHGVASIPPKLAVAECVRHFKGASAYAMNRMPGSDGQFKWQSGYGALSVCEDALEAVKAYAARQKEHHARNTVIDVYEESEDETLGDNSG